MNENNKIDTAQALWQRIEGWLSRHAPHAWQMLRPGASEGEIQQAEVAMGITLPEDFKASCRIHDGGPAGKPGQFDQPGGISAGFPSVVIVLKTIAASTSFLHQEDSLARPSIEITKQGRLAFLLHAF